MVTNNLQHTKSNLITIKVWSKNGHSVTYYLFVIILAYFVQGQAVAATPTAQTALPPPESQATPTLPHNWKMAKDPKGKPYYYHVITRKTQWDVPVSTDEGTIIMDLGTPEPEQSTEDGENSVSWLCSS